MVFKNTEFHNVEELIEEKDKGGYRIARLPKSLITKLNPLAQNSAYYTCGCELRFNLHSDEAIIYLRRDPCNPDIMPYGMVEVWQGDYQGRYQISPQPVGQDKTAIHVKNMNPKEISLLHNKEQQLFDPILYRVFIPYDWGHVICGIEGDISLPKSYQVPKKTLLSYGSSITHGAGSSMPTSGYAFCLARKLGMDLRNLGMAGAAHMDEAMAEYIAKQKWDIAILELGINVTDWTMKAFEEKARNFIHTIASAHPDRPIYCISMFTSYADFIIPEQIQGMRKVLHLIVEELKLPLLHYVDGSKCLPDLTGLTSDALHPSNAGMASIAEYLYQQINGYKED